MLASSAQNQRWQVPKRHSRAQEIAWAGETGRILALRRSGGGTGAPVRVAVRKKILRQRTAWQLPSAPAEGYM